MPNYNLPKPESIENAYSHGMLPQRNDPNLFYRESSCRSNLKNFNLSSENKRIINKTTNFSYTIDDLANFNYTKDIQKRIHQWVKLLSWNIPTTTVRTIFTKHLFNQVYSWYDNTNIPIAYGLCLKTEHIGHIGYVFYDPEYSHSNLPIRMVLQFVIDCQKNNLEYAYLGRFSEENGFYKRNMPGFEYYHQNSWQKYSK